MRSKRQQREAQLRQTHKLKSFVLVCLGSAVLLAVAAFLIKPYLPASGAPNPGSGGPSLQVDREMIDFGDVQYDNPVTASFRLTNTGDQPLRFVKPPYIETVEGC
jgi:hypothetical protein